MENLRLSKERQIQMIALWGQYKSENAKVVRERLNKDIDNLILEWEKYKDKILKDELTLDDYTNTLKNSNTNLPGGYLCNFLERTTGAVLGSSKPGTACDFEVKLNKDNVTYHILRENKPTASRDDAEKYFKDIKELIKTIVQENDVLKKIRLVAEAKNYQAKQILMKMAVLDKLTDFLYIYSTQVIEQLYSDLIDGDDEWVFTKNHQICLIAKKLLSVKEEDKSELILLSRFLWMYANAETIADLKNPNVILYGPPGTGKTYSVLNSLPFVTQGDSSRYKFLQFHPSFTYEDFIEGIKPKGVSGGNIRFELVNGVFKNFCIEAKNNPSKTYYFVVDEINRANLSSVFGETLSLLEKDYRHDGKSNKNLIKTQYSSLIEDLIKEDRDKYKDLAYIIEDNGEVKFGVPANVFFIGMMNDVDKSIDAFDLALRRRFKWIRKDCDYDVIEQVRFKNNEDFINIGRYITACESLNNYISEAKDNGLGLGKSYEFGHSFFMKIGDIAKRNEITEDNVETLFNLYLRPTLKEYFRAVFPESELDDKINKALIRFKKAMK